MWHCIGGRSVDSLSSERWIEMCEVYEADPFVGISLPTLAAMYANAYDR